MRQHALLSVLTQFTLVLFIGLAQATPPNPLTPKLPLAYTYSPGIALNDYWLSEKLDGVRAYWDGKQLLSKQGNVYHAPDWFIADFPAQPLDGELWITRNSFERVVSIVRDKQPGDGWREVHYMVFDMAVPDVPFTDRITKLKTLFKGLHSPYLRLIEQTRISSHAALMKKLDEVNQAGGEGLMLHKGGSYYLAGRSNDLLKVKAYEDAEARVIGHLPGKGKYNGMLGALLVETEAKQRFRIGTGFTDQQRLNPPPIGAIITYKYFGETANGLPRFASFMRIRLQ